MTFDWRNFIVGLLIVFLLLIGFCTVLMVINKRAEFHQSLKDRR